MNAALHLDPESAPITILWDEPLSDDAFEALCLANDLFRLERTKDGEVIVQAPAGGFTSDGNSEIVYQLKAWWKTHRRGRVFDASAGFFLRDGSMFGPDASYVGPEKLVGLRKKDLATLPRLCPDFVIELLSRTDRIQKAKAKMESWVDNGVQLAWLIDPYRKRVIVYRPGSSPVEESGERIAGSGPVEGFSLDLAEVWRCYEI